MNLKPGSVKIEPLGDHHDRTAFSCGNQKLDNYIKNQAIREERRNVSRVFIATINSPNRIAGFYTLSSTNIGWGELTEAAKRKLPRYPYMPAVLIGRLAVDVEFQGQGLGSYLLISALERVIQAESDVASFAIVVDAKDGAIPFYEQYGFIRVPSRSNRLFLPVETAKQSFGK